MSDILVKEIIRMADQLDRNELQQVIEHLQALLNSKKFTKEEFRQRLNAMSIDLGSLPADWSDSRENWYGDDMR